MDAMETGILTGAWREMIERAIIEIFERTLQLASAYLTVCYGIPANVMEFDKGE